MKRFQIVWVGSPVTTLIDDGVREWHWHPWFWGFQRIPPDSAWSIIYAWRLHLGPLEVRRWVSQETLGPALAAHNASRRSPSSAKGSRGAPE